MHNNIVLTKRQLHITSPSIQQQHHSLMTATNSTVMQFTAFEFCQSADFFCTLDIIHPLIKNWTPQICGRWSDTHVSSIHDVNISDTALFQPLFSIYVPSDTQ